jgi:hypothetical protein
MAFVEPVTLNARGVDLVPLGSGARRRTARRSRRWRTVEYPRDLGARA